MLTYIQTSTVQMNLSRVGCILGVLYQLVCRPRKKLSWMRRPTGDQEVSGSTPAEIGNILSIFFPSRKHAYIMLTPLKPHFYIIKRGFTGVCIIFLVSAQNMDCWYSLEPPRQSVFWAEIWKILEFLFDFFSFFGGNFFSIFR